MDHKRKLAALIIWWCEGTKSRKDKRWKTAVNCPVEVTNPDPKLIKIFLDFLRKDLNIVETKLHAQIQAHKGDNILELEKFWSDSTNIPLSQFNKTIVREAGNKQGKTKGTFKVRIYDKILFNRLKSLLEEELSELYSGSGSVG